MAAEWGLSCTRNKHPYEIHQIKPCFFHRPTTMPSSCFINDLFAFWVSTPAELCRPGLNTSLLYPLHPTQGLEPDRHCPKMWEIKRETNRQVALSPFRESAGWGSEPRRGRAQEALRRTDVRWDKDLFTLQFTGCRVASWPQTAPNHNQLPVKQDSPPQGVLFSPPGGERGQQDRCHHGGACFLPRLAVHP